MNELLQPDTKALSTAEDYRRRKMTSVLAIVFTDIVGSTHLREKLGEAEYESEREEFEAGLSEVICRDDAGAVVKGTGDGALAVFSEPSTAVERCLEVQENLRGHQLIKIRIGVDMGQVSVKSSFGIVADVFGRHVNRAARIEALAAPGHVLTSFHVYDCAMGWLRGENIAWHNHGSVPLKGFAGNISIHEIYNPQRCSPQNSQDFPRSPDPMFSRRAPRRSRPVKLDKTKWGALYEQVTKRSMKIFPAQSTYIEDPYSGYAERVRGVVESLVKSVPESPSILWVDDFPGNNAREHQFLRDAGCIVDLALSTEEAKAKLAENRYFLIITDMGRGQEKTAGLDLLGWCRGQHISAPIFLYASASAVAAYSEEAIAAGCALCTAGVVSLLDGAYQALLNYQQQLPVEYIE